MKPSGKNAESKIETLDFVEELLEYAQKHLQRIAFGPGIAEKAADAACCSVIKTNLSDILDLNSVDGWPNWKQHLYELYIKNTVNSYFATRGEMKEKPAVNSVGVNCNLGTAAARTTPARKRILKGTVKKIQVPLKEGKSKNRFCSKEKDQAPKVEKELWKEVFEKSQKLTMAKPEAINVRPSFEESEKKVKAEINNTRLREVKVAKTGVDQREHRDSQNRMLFQNNTFKLTNKPDFILKSPEFNRRNKFLYPFMNTQPESAKFDTQTVSSLKTNISQSPFSSTSYEEDLKEVENYILGIMHINPNYDKTKSMIESCFHPSSDSLEDTSNYRSKLALSTDDCILISPRDIDILNLDYSTLRLKTLNVVDKKCQTEDIRTSRLNQCQNNDPKCNEYFKIKSSNSSKYRSASRRESERLAFESNPVCKKVVDDIRKESQHFLTNRGFPEKISGCSTCDCERDDQTSFWDSNSLKIGSISTDDNAKQFEFLSTCSTTNCSYS